MLTRMLKIGAASALIATTPLAAAQDATSNEILRVYDLREYDSMLPNEDSGAPSSQLVSRLSALLGVRSSEVATGVYALSANSGGHTQFEQVLADVRGLHNSAYEVELTCVAVPRESAPSLGVSFSGDVGTVHALARQITRARSELSVESLRHQTYIESFLPVVSDNVVGYQAQPRRVDSGLTARLVIDGRHGDERVTVTAEGELADAEIEPMTITLGKDTLTIGLATEHKRSFSAVMSLKVGIPVVVGVVDGFDDETVLAVTIAVVEAGS